MGLSKRQVRVLILVGVLIGFVAAPVVGAIFDNSAEYTGIELHASDGPSVYFTEAGEAPLTDFTSDANTIDLHSTNGNISVSSDGLTNATVTQINGSWTNVSSIDTNSRTLTLDPDDKSAVSVTGGVEQIHYRDDDDIELGDGEADFVYSASGSGTIKLNSLPADTEFSAATKSGTDLGTYQSDSSGSASVTVGSASDAHVVLFTNHAPNASNFTPADGAGLTTEGVDFEVDVTDPEFGTAQGDQVEATLMVDNESVGSTTTTTNGTVSVTHTISEGGSHTYHWVLEDSYGGQTITDRQTISIPSELRIYNESAPGDLVDNASVELKIYVDGTDTPSVYERKVSDGVVNMTGLPADEPFVVVAEADGYYSRRIFVPSLYESQSVYLLPESETVADTIFTLEDYSGQYPPEDSVLLVQRALNGSYETVFGDFFGATGQFPAQLAYNERHRLVLLNVETGDRRRLGSYTPLTSTQQEVVVTPTGIVEVEPIGVTAQVSPQVRRLPALNDTELQFELNNRSVDVEKWNVSVTAGNETLLNRTYTSAGEFSETIQIENHGGEKATVRIWWSNQSGTNLIVEETFVIEETVDTDASLLAVLGDLEMLSDPGDRTDFTAFLSIVITVLVVSGVTTQMPVNGLVGGLTGVFMLTGFAVIGWVGYGLVFVSGVGVVSFAALKRGL